MEHGDRRLLRDLVLVGRIGDSRASARERLQAELGDVTFRRLFAERHDALLDVSALSHGLAG